MTFFSSRVRPRPVLPAVEAIAIDISSRDPVCPRWLRATVRNSSGRGLKKSSQRRKNDRKRRRKAPRRWDYDFRIRCNAKVERGTWTASALVERRSTPNLFHALRTETRRCALFLELL